MQQLEKTEPLQGSGPYVNYSRHDLPATNGLSTKKRLATIGHESQSQLDFLMVFNLILASPDESARFSMGQLSSGPDWSRTSTPLRAHAPQACASAYSATGPIGMYLGGDMWTPFPRTVILPVSRGPSTGYLLSRTILDRPPEPNCDLSWIMGHFPENQDQGMIHESTALNKEDCRVC